MIPHGNRNGYNTYGCRCLPCTVAVREYTRAYRLQHSLPLDPERARVNAEHVAERVGVWRAVYEHGRAGEVCDSIVRNRPVPAQLMGVIFGADEAVAA